MGCGNCGSASGGKPSGCNSNGGCSTGGCNRLNVFDWLSELPLSDSSRPYPIIEVSFNQGSRKEFFRNQSGQMLEKGEWIVVESTGGYDIGQVSLQGELVKLQMKKYGVTEQPAMKRVLHAATEDELDLYWKQKGREQELLVQSRAMARSIKLEMKVAEVEVQADGRKAIFFYTADQRVDFRELIKQYAGEFRLKVEMRQIGARQESAKVGGIGSCGRELCCSTWLTDFKSVNTAAARYQNLSINQTKLSGQCGRLKCCLNYELDTYMDALKMFPSDAEAIETVQGKATLQKRDIFKNLMWYSFYGSNKQYPMSIERVKEIAALNKEGVKPEALEHLEIESVTQRRSGGVTAKTDMGFVNDVGQITLKNLEKNSRNRKKNSAKDGNRPQGEGRKNNGQPQGDGKKANNNTQRQQGEDKQNPNANQPRNAGAAQGQKSERKPQQQRPPKPQQTQARQTEGGSINETNMSRPAAQEGEGKEQKPRNPNQRRNRDRGNRSQQKSNDGTGGETGTGGEA